MAVSEAHRAKMTARRNKQWSRPGYRAGKSRDQDIAKFCAYWKSVRRKNGVGSRQQRERFLSDQESSA